MTRVFWCNSYLRSFWKLPCLQEEMRRESRARTTKQLDKTCRKWAEYCFGTALGERTHWVLWPTRRILRKTRWVRFGCKVWHTNNRLRETHWARSPELSEPRRAHWVRCLKPYSPKQCSARFRIWAGCNKLFRQFLCTPTWKMLRIKFWPPPPTQEFLTKQFPSATWSRMEILT